jgi:hypothetical protein
MAVEGNLEYASARVHALHGSLPKEADWHRLEASRDLGHYLESARTSPLGGWVSSFDAHQDLHAIERSLRSQWMSHIRRVASWHPRDCQAWLHWLAFLPILPLLSQLSRPEAAPSWLLADPVVGAIASKSPAERAAALVKTPLAPLAPATRANTSATALWREHWQKLTPRMDPDTRDHLARLMKALDQHAAALAAGGNTLALRKHLRERLEFLFRDSAGTVLATACHLGRLGLELERLRGGLATRCLLPSQTSEAA